MKSLFSLVSRIARFILNFVRTFLLAIPFAMPVGLRRDVLYMWASFRLRRRPIKTFLWVIAIGLLCWTGQYFGLKYGHGFLISLIRQMPATDFKQVLGGVASAIFSSLNILSCISIVVIFTTLKHLLVEGHFEMIVLTPNRIRPSALFYAVGTRYFPLTLMALLLIYLHPLRTPFQQFPFKASPNPNDEIELMQKPWVLYWPAIRELSLLLFCAFNVFMDLTFAFWMFVRFRVTYLTLAITEIIVGVLEPVGIIWCDLMIDRHSRFFNYMNPYTRGSITGTRHYLGNAIASFFIAWFLLADLDARWKRRVLSGKDPVLMKGVD